ncbi:MAG: hypothetical protein ABIT10_02660 [Alteraurantiacibacter sp.]
MKQMRAFALFLAVMMIGTAAFASWAGYVVVVDETGMVDRANVVGFQGGSGLLGLPGGRYVGIPPYDGAVEVQCTDGSSLTGGLVARGQSTYLVVTGAGTCSQIG